MTDEHLDAVLHPQFAETGKVLTKGLAASPGAAVGKVYFTADEAADAAERGEKVVLVRNETSPEDVHGMMVAEGILTARGGLVSHAAVVARGWGTPAIVGAESVKIVGDQFSVGDIVVNKGDVISLDGTTGTVVLGAMLLEDAKPPAEFDVILQVGRPGPQGQARRAGQRRHRRGRRQRPPPRRRGHRAVPHRAHVPRPRPPAGRAQDDPRPDRRRRRRRRSTSSGRVQQIDFEEILEAMDGLPVTIRLLDPPLHEFLPSVEELRVKEAKEGPVASTEQLELKAAESWAEHNPMIGTRGVRLGVIKPGPVRDAGAGAARRRRVAAQARAEPDRRDHDPAHRHPRGDGAGPVVGPGRGRRRA